MKKIHKFIDIFSSRKINNILVIILLLKSAISQHLTYLRESAYLVLRGLDAAGVNQSKLCVSLPCLQLLPLVQQGVSEGTEWVEIHQYIFTLHQKNPCNESYSFLMDQWYYLLFSEHVKNICRFIQCM